ncbi:hypothetical protein SAMN02746098_01421 [Desulfosporosinus lacus DSM 15449]|uniref:Uncharacterized protein n=1 Tax=Desulfosporosinus lacus DSM 15449 TaxID=1121420 RepID=A0A1M5W2D8_9FIRM|nr:hypothetical protein SAMN02746098_01421 [Desulfosporosinus lacus DSM 15449]
MNNKELEALIITPVQKRYQYFIKKVQKVRITEDLSNLLLMFVTPFFSLNIVSCHIVNHFTS